VTLIVVRASTQYGLRNTSILMIHFPIKVERSRKRSNQSSNLFFFFFCSTGAFLRSGSITRRYKPPKAKLPALSSRDEDVLLVSKTKGDGFEDSWGTSWWAYFVGLSAFALGGEVDAMIFVTAAIPSASSVFLFWESTQVNQDARRLST
jgi:hypothetical protein